MKESLVSPFICSSSSFTHPFDLFFPGYRDDSLETVKQNRDDYEMELKILSYEELYGWTMDRIVGEIGKTNNCTFCGVFRRQALDRGAKILNVNCIATGHNADDIAETVIMNILRGDTSRLARCTSIKTVKKTNNSNSHWQAQNILINNLIVFSG